jgi:mono/diheme cytochrome c family protein
MTRPRFCLCVLCAAAGLALAYLLWLHAPTPAAARPAEALAPAPAASFINDVAPILKENCFSCHGAKGPKGKLDMTHFATLMKGGTKDEPIKAGKPDDSLLLNLIKADDKLRMPPRDSGDPLKPEQIAVIERWVKEGARLDGDVKPEADLYKELRARWKPPAVLASYPFPVVVNALAFTPDNAKLVVGGHHELTVWDVASGKLEKRVRTRARRALAMVFLADGKLAVAGGRPGEEGDVRVYDLNGSPGKEDNGVAVLDGVDDPKVLVARLLLSDDEVLCLALSKDGTRLASGGCDRTVNVWDVSAGADKAKLETSIENHADWVFGVAFSPDGKRLFTCSRDKTAKVWDLAAKESLLTFPDHQQPVNGVASKGDGKQGFSVGDDGQVRSWNVEGANAGKAVKAIGNHGRPAFKVVMHPSQPLLATCGADNTVKLWNPDSGAAIKTLSGHTDQVFAVALSPDGNLVASGTYNGEVKIWKVADGAATQQFNAAIGYQPPKK